MKRSALAPVITLVYNRPEQTRHVFAAIQEARPRRYQYGSLPSERKRDDSSSKLAIA